MILADTSVWIDHFRSGNKDLQKALNEGRIVIHPWIVAELALGSLQDRTTTLRMLDNLPHVRMAQIFVGLLVVGGAVFTLIEVRRSKAPGKHWLDIWAHRFVSLQRAGGPASAHSSARSSRSSKPTPDDAHKQAAWGTRFDRSEYESFESSWLSRRWEKEDGAA